MPAPLYFFTDRDATHPRRNALHVYPKRTDRMAI
jgi:hypothetical protein